MKTIGEEEKELKKYIIWNNGMTPGDTEIMAKDLKTDWLYVAFGVKIANGHVMFRTIKGARWNKEKGCCEKYLEPGPVFFKDLSPELRSVFLKDAKRIKEETMYGPRIRFDQP
jgi:hypothetical protein